MAGANIPLVTRLRYFSSKDKERLVTICSQLSIRIEIKDIVWDGKQHVLWFIPPDDKSIDIKSMDLDKI